MQAEDPLSRRPDHEEGVQLDNRDQILLKPEFFAVHAIEPTHETMVDDDILLQDVKKALLSDEVTKNYKNLLQSGPREFGKELQDWNYENGLLLHRGKVYIPKDKNEDLRRRIVEMHHDHLTAGHQGFAKTYELITRNYWWPGMSIFIKKYTKGCDICQRMKNRTHQPYGPLMPNKVPEGPWEIITVDLITQLPESDGYDAICNIVDRLTKRAHFYPITGHFTAKDTAQIMYDRIYPIHGLPLQIISDRGTQFAAELFQNWCDLLGIKSTMTTSYHPQADGQTERTNQTLEQYLRCYVDYNLDDWSRYLSTAEFAYNNAKHESTGYSPFFLEYGRNPRAGPTLLKEIHEQDLNDIMKKRLEAQEHAQAALVLAAERMKWYYDKGVQKVPFKKGDKVKLDLRDYQKTERALQPRWEGPFEIIEKLSDLTFHLKLPSKFRDIHPVFNAIKLAPWNEPEIEGQKKTPPEPLLVKGKPEFLVEKILQHRKYRGKTQYLVRWKGYGRDEDTWEPETNLKGAKEAIKDYLSQGFEAPARRKSTRKKARNLSLETSDGEDSHLQGLNIIPKARTQE